MDLSSLTPEQLASTPVESPPDGVVSNFVNPDSTASTGIILISIFLAIMVVTVGMRMYSRVFILRTPGLDDWTALAAAVFVTGSCAVPLYMFSHNWLGPHSWDIPLSVVIQPRYTSFLLSSTMLVFAANMLAKASLFLFLARIFPRHANRWASYAIWAGLSVNIAAYVALLLVLGIQCSPRPSDAGQFPAQCSQQARETQGLASSSINAGLDLVILAIAIPSLWALQMSPKKKIGATAVLGVGLVACGISMATLYMRTQPLTDAMRSQVLPLAFGFIEPLIAVTTASLPTLPALWFVVSAQVSNTLRGLLSRISSTRSLSRSRRGYDKRDGYELQNRSEDRITAPQEFEPAQTV